MPDLEKLRELCTWMRAERISYARCGELELRLELAPAPSPVAVHSPPDQDDADDERQSLETLLWSSGVDPEPFLRATRKAA